MAKSQTRIITHAPAPPDSHPQPAREGSRERLLAGLPVTERRLSLNGLQTSVLEGGDGPAIVLLHGPGESAAKWFRVIPTLVMTRRVVAPDLPGHGDSDLFRDSPDKDIMSGWLDDLIECTCPTRPVLIGQTIGGAIAASFASERSERLAGLVLVDTLGLTAFQPDPEFGIALHEFFSDPTEHTFDRLLDRCYFDLSSVHQRLGEQWGWIKAYNLERARTPGRMAALGALMEQFGLRAIPPATLARIAVQTTLIWGRHDLATPLPVAEEASSRFRWPLHVIDDAADDPALEQPDAFLNVLHAVLETTRRQEVAR